MKERLFLFVVVALTVICLAYGTWARLREAPKPDARYTLTVYATGTTLDSYEQEKLDVIRSWPHVYVVYFDLDKCPQLWNPNAGPLPQVEVRDAAAGHTYCFTGFRGFFRAYEWLRYMAYYKRTPEDGSQFFRGQLTP